VAAQDVDESEEERQARICSEGAKKRAFRRWTNMGHTPLSPLAAYASYGEGSFSSCHCRRSPTPPPSSFDDDEPEAKRVIGPKDFVNGNNMEARAMNEALRESQEAAATVEQHEATERRATLKGDAEFRRGRPPPTALRCGVDGCLRGILGLEHRVLGCQHRGHRRQVHRPGEVTLSRIL
jgi:hypothetical protein